MSWFHYHPLTDFYQSSFEEMCRGTRWRFSLRWSVLAIAGTAFLVGPRTTYAVLDVASVVAAVFVVFRVAPTYWVGKLINQ